MPRSKFISFNEALPVLTSPNIFSRISEDDVEVSDLSDSNDFYFIGMFDGSELIAVWWLIALSGTTFEVHAQILPSHRNLKNLSWQQCFELIKQEFPTIHKLQAKIPTCFPSVYEFSKNNGMVDEGLERQSKLINNQFCDQWCVGATVKEMEAFNGRG